MTLPDLVKPVPSLEADGMITVTVQDINTGKVIEAYRKIKFEGHTWLGEILDSICLSLCAHCGEVPHVTVDDGKRCCVCGIETMAQRKRNVFVQKTTVSLHYRIYSDHPAWKIGGVAGIACVGDYQHSLGYVTIDIDPRYDEKEVVKEIEDLK